MKKGSQIAGQNFSTYTLFSKKKHKFNLYFFLVPLTQGLEGFLKWSVAYNLPQKKCNIQKLAFILEKSVDDRAMGSVNIEWDSYTAASFNYILLYYKAYKYHSLNYNATF